MHLQIDLKAFLFVLPFCIIFLWLKQKKIDHSSPPYLLFSSTNLLKKIPKSLRLRFTKIPYLLKFASLVLFLLAFLNPRIATEISRKDQKGRPFVTEGIALYLVLDRSGSMSTEVVAKNSEGQEYFISKIQLLKTITKDFLVGDPSLDLKGRQSDLVGLVAFARVPQILSPLTLDHQRVLQQLNKIEVIKDKTEDGTAIGYAIYKTAHLISATRYYGEQLAKEGRPPYDIKGAAMILITDGFQNPNVEDRGNSLRTMGVEEAARYAKEQNIHLYIINIDPIINKEEYAPQRRLMQRSSELTGGKFFAVTEPMDLQKIYQDIDQLEKSHVSMPFKEPYRYIFFFPWLIALGMLSLGISILLETTALRRVP